MNIETPLSRGVENRVSTAGRLGRALEAGAGRIDRAFDHLFSRFLGGIGLRFNLRPLVLFLASVIRDLPGPLLEREAAHQQALAAVGEALARRNDAVEPVRRKMQFFRAVGLPILSSAVPRGPLSRTPSSLLEQARVTCRRLESRPLEDPPDLPAGVTLSPTLRTEFDAAVVELEAALASLETARRRASWTRRARHLAMAELDVYLRIARNVARVLGALPGERRRCRATVNAKGGSHGEPRS